MILDSILLMIVEVNYYITFPHGHVDKDVFFSVFNRKRIDSVVKKKSWYPVRCSQKIGYKGNVEHHTKIRGLIDK